MELPKLDILNQAKEFYDKLAAWQKYSIIGIAGAIFLGALALIFLTPLGSEEEKMSVLYSNLEEKDAGKIIEYLKERQIEYVLEDNGTTILTKEPVIYETRMELAQEGLPSTTVGYEIFDRTNLGMSEFVQKLNYRRALEGELAKTISSIEEIKKARVHIVIPERTLFEKDQQEPTASVSLKFVENKKAIPQASVVGIQNLVANSVEGMQTDAVKVVDHRGKVLSPEVLDENSIAGKTASQYAQQTKVEKYLANKIQTMLDGILGYGNSEVNVNAELDFTKIERTITDFDAERQAVRSEQSILDKSESLDSLSYPAKNNTRDQSNVISNYEIPKRVEHIVENVGNIKRLSVAASINCTKEIVETEGKKQIVPKYRTPEEMEELTLLIKNSVGFDPLRNDQISVKNLPFDTLFDEDEIRNINITPWWRREENIRVFGLVLAMILIMFMMFKLLQSKQVKERIRIAFQLPESPILDEDDDDEVEEVEEEELEELVLDEDELLLLPAEIPEQLLLEEEIPDEEREDMVAADEGFDRESLAAQARASLDEGDAGEMTEDALMMLELKKKVEDFVDENPQDAVKLIRFFLSQDFDEKAFNF